MDKNRIIGSAKMVKGAAKDAARGAVKKLKK